MSKTDYEKFKKSPKVNLVIVVCSKHGSEWHACTPVRAVLGVGYLLSPSRVGVGSRVPPRLMGAALVGPIYLGYPSLSR
jgi:hypothetical protein